MNRRIATKICSSALELGHRQKYLWYPLFKLEKAISAKPHITRGQVKEIKNMREGWHIALELVKQWKARAEADGTRLIVRVEDARQRKWFGHDEWKTAEERKKKLQGVGSVKRDSSIWDDFLADLGVEYQMVPPRYNVTKLTQEQFQAMTGWKKRTNEHKRDAAMLVYGF